MSAGEVSGVLFAVAMIAATLAFSFGSGLNLGAHIWRPGWFCGQSLKGAPWCWPAPTGKTSG